MPDVDVAVVGAGLAGLCAALRLSAAGRSVQVFEASDGVGGRVRTDVVDGYRLDRGFQVYDTAYPESARVLDHDALDLQLFPNGALLRYDSGFIKLVDPRQDPLHSWRAAFAPFGTWRDKLALARLGWKVWRTDGQRLLDEPELPAYDGFRRAGLSDVVIERLLRPFLSGVLLEDELTTSSRYVELVLRCFARGRQAVPATGMGAIPQQLAARLPTPVALHREARSVTPGQLSFSDGSSVTAEAVVVAADPTTAAGLVPALGPAPKARRVTTYWFAADESVSEGGLLALNGEGFGPVGNVLTMTECAPGYGPGPLVQASTLHADVPERDVRDHLRSWYGPTVDRWSLLATYAIPYALPAAEPPQGRLRGQVRAEPGLYVCGDWRDSPSIQGAMVSGRRAAEALIADQPERTPA